VEDVMVKVIASFGTAVLLLVSASLFARSATGQGSVQGQGQGSMGGMQMSDGGMMQGGMADGGMMGGMGGTMADGGMMGGGGMMADGGMMGGDGMMGGMSCSQMMGNADVTVRNTKDGAIMTMRAKSKDQVQHVQQMARMMKNCMSGGGQQR
jgi:hypothetical protein